MPLYKMETIVIPGFSQYEVAVTDVGVFTNRWNKKRLLKSIDGSRHRYTLIGDDGVKKRGYLNYWRRKCGLPPIDLRFNHNTKEEFYSHTKQVGECWLWTGTKKQHYGIINTGAKHIRYADTISYYFANGGNYYRNIVHTCGNRDCINPAHLKIGTKEEQEYYEKRRHLSDTRILYALSDKYVIDIEEKKVYANRYIDLKELKPNDAGKYFLHFNKGKHYMTFDEILSGKLVKRKKDKQVVDYFWEKVDKKDNIDECWEWTGAKASGYGNFGTSLMGETRAHRIAYILLNGSIEKDNHIMHKCDNPSCVNPFHLESGTNDDNVLDKINKGRHMLNSDTPIDGNKMEKLIDAGIEYQDIEKVFSQYSPSTIYLKYRSIINKKNAGSEKWS